MSIDLSALSTRQALTAVYIGYYDRAADPAGIQFWEQVVANTSLDLEAITSDFAGQAETQAVHPFFADPTTSSASVFITSLYQNLFNRDPDDAGLIFWSDALEAAVAGDDGAISVGEIITSIIEGAVDIEGGTQDRTTILNKIEVGLDWTEAAEEDGGDFDDEAMASAKSIIEGVTSDSETVTAAKAATDDFFAEEPVVVPGGEYFLTSGTDAGADFTGTASDDVFNAYIAQNPFAGGVSNTLSSADRLDGGAGDDRLYAEVTGEFVGVAGNISNIDIQPRLSGIEEIDIEARESNFGNQIDNVGGTVTVDAKNIVDHVEIGSYYSDGNLTIENVTTLTSAGTVRNTSDITVKMDHTDNFNTDGDASDLTVYFDNDYLVSGQVSVGTADFFLLDQDAELRIQSGQAAEGRLDEIDKNGIRFSINGQEVVIEFDGDLLNETNPDEINDHDPFIAALQAPLAEAIAAGLLPEGTEIVRFDYTNVIRDDDNLPLNQAALQDGSFSDLIPSIRVISGDGSPVTPLGFTAPDEITGEFNVFGRFDDFAQSTEEPISVGAELGKAGRGGEGGNLIIGAKASNDIADAGVVDGIADGIEVINLTITGGGNNPDTGVNDGTAKPSNVGTITSTGYELSVVNIVTDPDFAGNPASLTVREGFDEDLFSDVETGDLMLVNADMFLGDLTLGTTGFITNLDTLNARGGGDVSFQGFLNGTETAQAYDYNTGSGADSVRVVVAGDALDYAGSSLDVSTGTGDDDVEIISQISGGLDADNNQLNQAILNGVNVNTGSGADTIDIDGIGNVNIVAGSGNDVIKTDGNGNNAVWAFNFDAVRAAEFVGTPNNISSNPAEDLPGEQLSLAFLGGASITVTLSGAGGTAVDGGGVMSAGDAVRFDNGYESISVINSLNNGNEHFGDQTDINDAILDAINNDPVLSTLLTASIAADNTLVIVATDSGNFNEDDLRIDIVQETYTSSTFAGSVVSEAQMLFADSDITATDLFLGTAAASRFDGSSGYGADLQDSAAADAYYDGLSVASDAANNSAAAGVGEGESNLHTMGSASNAETDNIIDAGEGNDIIVLSTDAEANTVSAFTVSSNNALINGASNEEIVLTGRDFGDDVVMNFTAGDSAVAGIDFLNFDEYLTSMVTTSGSTTSESLIDVTLETDTDDVDANEVAVITFDPTNNAAWEGLDAGELQGLFNNSDGSGDYDGLSDGDFSVTVDTNDDDVVDGASTAIVMVENADNDGEYRVFEVTWNSSDTPATQSHAVSVTELGELDFGESLDDLTETNLVGSMDFGDLLTTGF